MLNSLPQDWSVNQLEVAVFLDECLQLETLTLASRTIGLVFVVQAPQEGISKYENTPSQARAHVCSSLDESCTDVWEQDRRQIQALHIGEMCCPSWTQNSNYSC